MSFKYVIVYSAIVFVQQLSKSHDNRPPKCHRSVSSMTCVLYTHRISMHFLTQLSWVGPFTAEHGQEVAITKDWLKRLEHAFGQFHSETNKKLNQSFKSNLLMLAYVFFCSKKYFVTVNSRICLSWSYYTLLQQFFNIILQFIILWQIKFLVVTDG